MKLPLTIHRSLDTSTVSALLLESHDTATLLYTLSQLDLNPLPRVLQCSHGFLLLLDIPLSCPPAGITPLQDVNGRIFFPAGAILQPAISNIEADKIADGQRVLILPYGFTEILTADSTIDVSTLLAFPKVGKASWAPLPQPKPMNQEVNTIHWQRPDDPESLLQQGGGDIGTDSARPDKNNLKDGFLGRAQVSMGKKLAGLGKTFGMDSLAKAGGNLIGKGLDRAPGITEGLLGKQDAALRSLLNKFKSGNIDDALKRAMPMTDESGRGSKQSGGTQLPFQNLLYSLGSLMAGGGGGSSWFTDNSDVYESLRQEYRKAAEQAESKGDFRRTAYIYGRLLGDFKHAARVLERGGLHHDAAVIYEKKLNDRRAAANAFEAAGEIDEAIRLFVHIKDWSAAGELYMRHGEDERAITMFTYAADEHAQAGAHFAAGHVMFSKAHRPDLAKPYLQKGWQRQSTDGVRCGIKLLDVHADAEDFENVDRLIFDAERKLTSHGQRKGHAQFFNHVAKLSEQELLNEELPGLNDRARAALAGNLREQVKRGHRKPAAEVFTDNSWSNATISDADYAARHYRKPKPARKPGKHDGVVSLVRVLDKDVSCFAMSDDTLLLGTYDGQLTTFTPEAGPQHHQISDSPLYDVAGVGGDNLITTISAGADKNSVQRFYRSAHGSLQESRFIGWQDDVSDSNSIDVTTQAKAPISVHVLGAEITLVPWGQKGDKLAMGDWRSVLSQVLFANAGGSLKILCVTGSTLQLADLAQFNQLSAEDQAQAWESLPLHTTPRGPIKLTTIAKDCVGFPAVTTNGGLFWTQLAFNPSGPSIENHFIEGGEFMATTYTGVGRIAAIADDSVHWFKQQGETFIADGFTQGNFRNVIGMCWFPKSEEVGVITRHGEVHLLSR